MNAYPILLIVEDFNIGGLERIVESIYNNLDSNRYRPVIWSIAAGGELANRLIQKGEHIRILNIQTYFNPMNMIKLAYLIRKGQYRIVHTHGYFAGVIGRVSAFLARTPIIIAHVHTTGQHLSPRNLWIDNKLSLISDCIICCSRSVKEFVVKCEKVKVEKVKVVYNGVVTPKCDPLDLEKNAAKNHRIQIVIVASLVINKGHKYLIEAISKLLQKDRDVNLVIVGDGPQRESLKNYAKKLNISRNIQFEGVIHNVHDVLKKSDIFVLPSINREGLGISIIEAMSLGLPVIGSNIGGIPELIEDGVNGFIVPPRDSNALAEKLEVLIQDKDMRYRMGKKARQCFENGFNVVKMIRSIEKIYYKLLKKNVLHIENSISA